MLSKFLPVRKMKQSKQIIASLLSNSFERVLKMTQSKQSIASLINAYKKIFSCSKDDEIKTDYCITVFKQF